MSRLKLASDQTVQTIVYSDKGFSLTIIADPDCPPGVLYFVPLETTPEGWEYLPHQERPWIKLCNIGDQKETVKCLNGK